MKTTMRLLEFLDRTGMSVPYSRVKAFLDEEHSFEEWQQLLDL